MAVAGGVGGAVGFDSDVVADCAGQENVVPAADVEGWNLNVGETFFDGPMLPVGVVIGMGQPIEILGGRVLRWRRRLRAGRSN